MHRSYDWSDDYSYSYNGRNNKMSDNKTGDKSTNIVHYCNNCGKCGHLFSNCIVPITSLGIIAFRKKITKDMKRTRGKTNF